SSSLDYETTLRNVAELAVPGFADWCSVDILDESGTVQRVVVHHSDPAMVELAKEYAKRFPPHEQEPGQVALRTGTSVLIPEITDEMIDQGARSPQHAAALRQLQLRSVIVAPLVIAGDTLGVLTFV